MTAVIIILSILSALLAAAGAYLLWERAHRGAELAVAKSERDAAQAQAEELRADLGKRETELATAQSRETELKVRIKELEGQRDAFEQLRAQQVEELEKMQRQFREAFDSLALKALERSGESFLKLAKGELGKKEQAVDALIKPIKELLEKQGIAVGELEKKRSGAYVKIEEQIKQIIASNEKLDRETGRLVTALRRPEQRGRWGEMQLRNVVELAGMTEHSDFHEQVQTDDPNTRDRPDMTVHMPGDGVIVVDSKVALDAYLDALQPDADREALLIRHAGQVEAHYKKLAGKRYWEQFERTPKLVVMFMPLESALVAALEVKPDLHAEAMENHILIATPTLLVALLRAVAYGWRQEDVAANAREIERTGKELYDRLATFVSHFEKVGTGLRRTKAAYNDAVGSLEHRILPSTRKLRALGVTTEDEIESPAQVEVEVRDVTASELKSLPTSDEDTVS
ncbi:MAG: DNA recombination protein RmuC [Phycisphaerales bacterium]|nr:DNA recombination protein RmuC [Phycisphaerales bacterium]